MSKEKNTVDIPSESRLFAINQTPPEVVCGECYREGTDDILMGCHQWRKDTEEYHHDTVIAEYKCDKGHAFRLVTFL